jgi:hypothetical protein
MSATPVAGVNGGALEVANKNVKENRNQNDANGTIGAEGEMIHEKRLKKKLSCWF